MPDYVAVMLAVLENPEIRQRATPFDVETYHRLGEMGLIEKRTELLAGVIVDKMSISPLHEFLTARLTRLIQEKFRGVFHVRKEAPITLAAFDSEPEPDVAVVDGNEEDYLAKHPETAHLLIEICVSTEQTDRAKSTLYARAGIPECWLVLAERAEVEILRAPSAEGYAERRTYHRGETAESTALPSLRVAVDDLFLSA